MGRFKIICINKNPDGDIIQVGIEGLGIYVANAIIDEIMYKVNEYYTIVPGGYEANVFVKPKGYGGYYLTTSPDGIQPNNLDSLPPCTQ